MLHLELQIPGGVIGLHVVVVRVPIRDQQLQVGHSRYMELRVVIVTVPDSKKPFFSFPLPGLVFIKIGAERTAF